MTPQILYLVSWLMMLGAPVWAADVMVDVTTQAGGDAPVEIAIIGMDVPGPDDVKAIKQTLPAGTKSVTIPAESVDKAIPGTTWVCGTARKVGTTEWRRKKDGSYSCAGWTPKPVVLPPIVDPPVVTPPVVTPPVVTPPAVTKADLDALLSLIQETEGRIRADTAKQLKQQFQSVAPSIETGCDKKNSNYGACFSRLREALKGVNP